jgi:hypothetical protein
MVSKAVYGELIWKEMGKDLSHWNVEAVEILTEASFSLFMVDVFHFCKHPKDVLLMRHNLYMNSTLHPRLVLWASFQV